MSISVVEQKTEEIYQIFKPVEGLNTVYYGKIGNGKTRNATADIIELCNRGEVVYANWKIEVTDYDERSSLKVAWAKFLGGRKYFYRFKKENFHYIDPQALIDNVKGNNIAFFSQLVGVHIFIDEGQWIFNSLERYDPHDANMVEKLKLILHGRHYCRSLNIITQRYSNISRNMRSQVSIWYRCVKRWDAFGFIVFQRWAIQDMKNDEPVEFISKIDKKTGLTIRDIPNGDLKTYFVNKRHDKIFPSYNTHAMRSEDAVLVMPEFDAFESNRMDRFLLLLSLLFPRIHRFMRWIRVSLSRFKKLALGPEVSLRKSTFPLKKTDLVNKKVFDVRKPT